MLALISPAKTLDYETALPTDEFTQPRLLENSAQLIDVCRKLSASEIANLMSVSEKLPHLMLIVLETGIPNLISQMLVRQFMHLKGCLHRFRCLSLKR